MTPRAQKAALYGLFAHTFPSSTSKVSIQWQTQTMPHHPGITRPKPLQCWTLPRTIPSVLRYWQNAMVPLSPNCCGYNLHELSNNQTMNLAAYIRDLTRCESAGTRPEKPTYVAIKGTVFDVSGNQSYAPGGSYHGKLPRRILTWGFIV